MPSPEILYYGAADQRAERNMSPRTGTRAQCCSLCRLTRRKTSKWHASVFTGPFKESRGEGVLDFTWDVRGAITKMLFSVRSGNSEMCVGMLLMVLLHFGNSAKIIHRGNVVRLREQNHLRNRQRLWWKAPKLPSRNRIFNHMIKTGLFLIRTIKWM